MNKTLMKLQKLNQSKGASIGSVCVILYLNLLLVLIFIQYFQNKAALNNPLIPREIVDVTFEQNARKGLILSIGFIVILLLKFTKQNFLAILAWIIVIAIYNFTTHIIEWPN